MKALLCISVTASEAERLTRDGPARDFVELARVTGGTLLYRDRTPSRRLRDRVFGPHLRQAWMAGGQVRSGDAVFADSEHVGLPLLAFLFLRRRKPGPLVMLGHLPGRRWKRALLAVTSRLVSGGVLVLHSLEQRRAVSPWLARSWRIELVPYQVDTQFWRPEAPEEPLPEPLFVAVGSEARDYETLVAAAEGVPARFVIAAGSHWARRIASAGRVPANVEFLTDVLPFSALRRLYSQATAVLVPLHDAPNQSGVTTILEGMSMARPIVLTATRGQQEYVTGPLATESGLDETFAERRGPHRFKESIEPPAATGIYVPVRDAGALRLALNTLLASPDLAHEFGEAGRTQAVLYFDFPGYVEALAALLGAPGHRLAERQSAIAEPTA
jgi:glycosyltransferase involved in cell wall biosynthesis